MLRIRQIQTTTDKDGKVVPVLDADGREIELSSIEVPLEVELQGGDAVDTYVAAALAARSPAPDPAPDQQETGA